MAKPKETPKPKFVMVEKSPKIGAGNRQTEGGTVAPTGRLPLNAEGSDMWRSVVKATGLPLENHLAKFGVDLESQSVAAYPVPHGTPNAAPVRINMHKRGADTFTLYLGGVFDEYHELRPVGNRAVKVTPDTDEADRQIMLISLASSLQTRTMPQDPAKAAQAKAEKAKRSRKRSKQELPATDAAAAEQPAEQPEPKAE